MGEGGLRRGEEIVGGKVHTSVREQVKQMVPLRCVVSMVRPVTEDRESVCV